MKKNYFFFALALCLQLLRPLGLRAQNEQKDWVQYVNPLVGTDSDYKLSNGNTYPSISLPFGMNAWTAQTAQNGDG